MRSSPSQASGVIESGLVSTKAPVEDSKEQCRCDQSSMHQWLAPDQRRLSRTMSLGLSARLQPLPPHLRSSKCGKGRQSVPSSSALMRTIDASIEREQSPTCTLSRSDRRHVRAQMKKREVCVLLHVGREENGSAKPSFSRRHGKFEPTAEYDRRSFRTSISIRPPGTIATIVA